MPGFSDIFDYFWPVFLNFALLVLAGIGFPVPEEVPTVTLGIWVGYLADSSNSMYPLRWLALPAAFCGVIAADVLLYWIGRRWGRRLLQHRWLARIAPADKREKIEQNFRKHGVKILLMIRWVPAIRSPMFITAGISRLSFPKFLIADATAAVIGHTLLFFLAWWFGIWFKEIVEKFEHLKEVLVPLAVILVIVGVGVYLLIHFLRRPVSVGDPDEFPIIGSAVAKWGSKAGDKSQKTEQGPAQEGEKGRKGDGEKA